MWDRRDRRAIGPGSPVSPARAFTWLTIAGDFGIPDLTAGGCINLSYGSGPALFYFSLRHTRAPRPAKPAEIGASLSVGATYAA